jgi:chromosome segregation ATPase
MKFVRVAALLLPFLPGCILHAQNFAPGHQSSRDPLSDSETEELRRTADTPPERVKTFMRFLDERSAKISELNKATLVEHRTLQLHDAIARFAGLTDELQDNLDEYQDYETNHLRPVPDLRKVLQQLETSTATWQSVLSSLPANEDYDFALDNANESLKTLKEQTAEMVPAQTKFFAEKKKLDKEKQKQTDNGYVLP